MEFLKIVILGVLAAVVYGIVHDQVTVRVCIEYFTIGHPSVFSTRSPTLLALGWGVIATWWVGLPLGVMIAVAARAGRRPRVLARDLLRPVVTLLLIMAAFAAAFGVSGYVAANRGVVWLVGEMAARVPPERHAAFIADLWAHRASYAVGALGGVILTILTWGRGGRVTPATSSAFH